MSHTKGPWTAKMLNLEGEFRIDGPDNVVVAECVRNSGDALIIASSISLLDAAEEVLRLVDPANDAGQQPLRQLADAVRRAKGV